MKRLFVLGIISILINACNHDTSANIQAQELPSHHLNVEKKASDKIPSIFMSGDSFEDFINSTELSYPEKEQKISDFYASLDQYSQQSLAKSLANIGYTIKWDVDLISQFQHGMQETFKNNPALLCNTVQDLSANDLENFSTFYFSGVLWHNDFPKELYHLQACNHPAYKTVIESFYHLYTKNSDSKYAYHFKIKDSDGRTNVREENNSNSQIVGTLPNESKVKSLWKKGNWIFVKSEDNIGYVYMHNIVQTVYVPAQLEGVYKFDNYQTSPLTGTGVGVFYTLKLKTDYCHIDMEGYQVDKNFGCYTKPINNTSIEIYDAEKNKKFGTIHVTNGNQYRMDLSYYYENHYDSYVMEKVE